jgi:hypothetical protein
LQLAQAHAHCLGVTCRLRAFRKQRDLPFSALFKHLDRLAPGELLTVVDLARLQHLALHELSIQQTSILLHAPVVVRLAVLDSLVRLRNIRQRRDKMRHCQGPKS